MRIRRWIGNLHGGQLLMLTILLVVVGYVPMWIGQTVYLEPGNRNMAFANDTQFGNPTLGLSPDTAAATAIRAEASRTVDTGLRWILAGLIVWLLVVAMWWWWFGARRRLA